MVRDRPAMDKSQPLSQRSATKQTKHKHKSTLPDDHDQESLSNSPWLDDTAPENPLPLSQTEMTKATFKAASNLLVCYFDKKFTLTQTKVEAQKMIMASLSEKVDDLENRHRRSNLRFIGIPEKVKGPTCYTSLP